MQLNTFSIVAYDETTGSFGIAVSTARPVVGVLVPFVSPHAAIATQAYVNTDLGRHGLSLIEAGVPIELALQSLLDADDTPARRQIHGITAHGHFLFTGEQCVEWAGHRRGDGFSVAGNMLAGPQVVEQMAAAYDESAGQELNERLVRALEAGQRAGGDKRGKQSAALLISSPTPRMYHSLRVDDHTEPVAELRRIHDLVVESSRKIQEEYGDAGLRLFSKIRI